MRLSYIRMALFMAVSLLLCTSCTQDEKAGVEEDTSGENSDNNTGRAPDGVVAVDLGLSVKWANCNVGATKPEEYGGLFAWGETDTKSTSGWETYKLCNGFYNKLTKYNNTDDFGTVDNKFTLDPEDDVAHVKWGGSWRMPTKEELEELRNNCTWTWYGVDNTEFGGVAGYKVTSNKEGYTGCFIFLPAAGYQLKTGINLLGEQGKYWSNSLFVESSVYSLYLTFRSGNFVIDFSNRYIGLSVRPVCP